MTDDPFPCHQVPPPAGRTHGMIDVGFTIVVPVRNSFECREALGWIAHWRGHAAER